jgi:hypothetical protein
MVVLWPRWKGVGCSTARIVPPEHAGRDCAFSRARDPTRAYMPAAVADSRNGGARLHERAWVLGSTVGALIRSDSLGVPLYVLCFVRVHRQMGGALARSGKAMNLKASPRAAAAKSAGPMMAAGGFVPDMGRRQLMNAFLLGSIAGPLLVLPAVLISYLTPAKAGGGGGGTVAKDALGNDVKEADWLKANGPGARKLVQGLKVSTSSPCTRFLPPSLRPRAAYPSSQIQVETGGVKRAVFL